LLYDEAFAEEDSAESESDENVVSFDKKTQHHNFSYKIVEFIQQSNLNKTATSSLLSLLRLTYTSTICDIPTSTDLLWKQLNISFNYETFFFCSTCFKQLVNFQDICVICNNKQKNNSELCIFSLADEIRRVVVANIQLIEWYQLKENQVAADIVNSKS
jgi:hypothetical protein